MANTEDVKVMVKVSEESAAKEEPDFNASQEVPLSALSHLVINWAFVKRSCRILSLGLGTPAARPKLWCLVILDLVFQCVGAYMLQSMLYPLATGINDGYPGISGCLKKGCGTVPLVPGFPSTTQIDTYLNDFAWMFIVSMFCVVMMSYCGDMINTIMRENVATSIQKRLLKDNKLLYRLNVDGTLDNIDQRMTSDLQVMLDGFTCVMFGNSADYLAYPFSFMICRFAFALNNCFDLPEAQNVDAVRGPVVGIFIAAVTIAFVAYILPINHVSRIFFRGQKYEGDFRTTHTRTVLNCEQISLLNGEAAERSVVDGQYRRLDMNNRIYYLWQGVLLILRLLITISIPAVSYVCLAVMGTRSSTTANFFQKQMGDVLEYSLYVPVLLERLAFACGATHRVGQLLEKMDLFEASPVTTNIEHNHKRVELQNVRANPPIALKGIDQTFGGVGAKKALFEGVNLTVDHGESVCIVGPSGCGKSSLLRVIGGLWGIDSGVVVRPQKVGKDGIFFLPQKPYVFPGSLAAQIIYPLKVSGDAAEQERAKSILHLVHLQHLVERYGMDKSVNWPRILSMSEMQRLNFARLFFQQPAFCLADECTSALDLRVESFLYQTCKEKNISMISVAHRPTVIPHHDFVFKFDSATHSWSRVPAADVATCEKFPTAGLEQLTTHESAPDEDIEVEDEGLNLRFVRRLKSALGMGFKSGWKSQAVVFLLIQFCCMGCYSGVQILVFSDYGTSKIIANIVGIGDKTTKKVIAYNVLNTTNIANITGVDAGSIKSVPNSTNQTYTKTTSVYTPYTREVQTALNDSGTIIGLNLVISVVSAVSCLVGAMLGVKIQRGIIKCFHENYFAPGVVYHINSVMKERGIDQRMVQDLSGFRESLAWLFGSPFAYCNYRVGFLPLLMVWIVLTAYAFSVNWRLSLFFFLFMMWAFISQIMSSAFTSLKVGRRQSWEGDMRLHLGRVLQNIESITFFGGEAEECGVAEGLLGSVVSSRYIYNNWANLTTVPTITMYYWLQTGVYVMAAILQVRWATGSIAITDTVDSDGKAIAFGLFTTISFCIIWAKVTQLMIMCLGGFGMVVGFTHRVMHTVERVQQARVEVEATRAKLRPSSNSSALVVFDSVSVAIPSNDPAKARILIKNLSASIPSSICVAGHAKSSLMRVLAGIWPLSSGKISRPAWGKDGIFFVPQANYATQGTLAANVVYPLLIKEVRPSDQEILDILDEVGMGEIASRWGIHEVVNWDMVLSGGECQRLGFARVLFHKPKVAVLDETSSALDMALERRCMEALTRRKIQLLSFAARPSIAEYHEQQLKMGHNGECTEEVGV